MQKRIECVVGIERSESNFMLHIYENARMHGLTGEVFTRDDGSIKIIAEGEEEALEKFAKKMQRGHSLFGMFTTVDNFFVKWEEPTGEFNEFSIKDTKY